MISTPSEIRPSAGLIILAGIIVLLQACAGQRPVADHSQLRDRLLSAALQQKGVPYRYGGTQPGQGFDCSGLVQYSYHRIGLTLPRNSYDQYQFSRPVYISRLQPGDLVFFRTNGIFVSHVGIYLGDNRFLHAPGRGKRVSVAKLNSRYWQRRLVGGGSVMDRVDMRKAEYQNQADR